MMGPQDRLPTGGVGDVPDLLLRSAVVKVRMSGTPRRRQIKNIQTLQRNRLSDCCCQCGRVAGYGLRLPLTTSTR